MKHIIYQGNSLEVLKQMESESVSCVITSPPYYGLRKYSGAETVWDGDVNCEHQWEDKMIASKHKKGETNPGLESWCKKQGTIGQEAGQVCSKCGAWRGQLGNEPNVNFYIAHLLQIFRETKRVMRKDATLWVNLADSYAGSGCNFGGGHQNLGGKYDYDYLTNPPQKNIANVKAKSLIGVPERFMLAMIDEGFILRNKIIWVKQILLPDNTTIGSCMPSSCKDRANQSSWECLYFFTKSPKYYFNLDAIRAKLVEPQGARPRMGNRNGKESNYNSKSQMDYRKELWKNRGLDISYCFSKEKRKTKIPEEQAENFGSPRARQHRKGANTGENNKEPYKQNNPHTIRLKLGPKDFNTEWEYRQYIRQGKQYEGKGTPQGTIKSNWHRQPFPKISERKQTIADHSGYWNKEGNSLVNPNGKCPPATWLVQTECTDIAHFATYPKALLTKPILAGCPQEICLKCDKPKKRLNCKCATGFKPGVVLDIFAGVSTTGLVATKLGRQYIGIEISPDYCKLGKKRMEEKIGTLFNEVKVIQISDNK